MLQGEITAQFYLDDRNAIGVLDIHEKGGEKIFGSNPRVTSWMYQESKEYIEQGIKEGKKVLAVNMIGREMQFLLTRRDSHLGMIFDEIRKDHPEYVKRW